MQPDQQIINNNKLFVLLLDCYYQIINLFFP